MVSFQIMFLVVIIASHGCVQLPLPDFSNMFQCLDNIPKIVTTSGNRDIDNRIIAKYKLSSKNKDKYLNITQLIKKHKYPVEEHRVTTEDGYKLKMFRIPGDGPVVFLMHGLLSSSDDWITPGTNSGIGFLLAAEGYDVWMGNARGNKHSRHHVNLSPKDKKFWDFSWEEIGRYDLASMIDYVLDTTEEDQLIYIGHSQGTTSFFVLCSMRPEYNKKISLMVALSPVAWMSHSKSPLIRLLSTLNPLLDLLVPIIGIYEVLPKNGFIDALVKHQCGTEALATIICGSITNIICGLDFEQLNIPQLPVIYSHTPAGSSTKQILHYAQEMESGFFRRYDYGDFKNIEVYGESSPPSYPVQKITAPVAIFWSGNDWFADIKDVKLLRKKLKNVVDFYKVPHKNFNHVDYMWAKDIKKIIWPRLSQLLKTNN